MSVLDISAVLAHKFPDGLEKPVAYAFSEVHLTVSVCLFAHVSICPGGT